MNKTPKIVFLPHANLQYSQLRPEKRGGVVETCYERLFDLVARKDYQIGFEASGFTVDRIAELNPRVMGKLRALISSGHIEPVASPYIHVMLSNIDPEVGAAALLDGAGRLGAACRCASPAGMEPRMRLGALYPRNFSAGGVRIARDGRRFLFPVLS